MKKLFITIAALLLLIQLTTSEATAAGKIAGHSAIFASIEAKQEDFRVKKLRSYLESKHSPLAPYAETFIAEADANNIDWRFVVSVAGVESAYGKRIPGNSYNGWGWGIYGGKVTRFTSWDEGIQTVSREIRTKYMTKWGAKDIHDIGRRYAANPMWAYKVTSFMEQLEAYEAEATSLPISI